MDEDKILYKKLLKGKNLNIKDRNVAIIALMYMIEQQQTNEFKDFFNKFMILQGE